MRQRHIFILIGICILLITLIGIIALCSGSPTLTLHELLEVLRGEGDEKVQAIVIELRMARFVLGVLAGAMLALSGVLLQDAMHNALAGPEMLGVSAGAAAVMAVLIIFQLPIQFIYHPILAMTGGFIGGGVVLITSRNNSNPVRVILIGAAVSAFLFSMVIVIISYGTSNSIALFYQYLVGNLANRTWIYVKALLPWAVFGFTFSWLYSYRLNIMQLGNEVAQGLGLHVKRTRLVFMALSVVMVSAVVSACGPIGYVALLAPHLTRRIIRSSNSVKVIPVSALMGAMILTSADLFSRRVFYPIEIPVGIWTTIIGGPFLLFLLQKKLINKGV